MEEKEKKQWRIPCTWSVTGNAIVEADTLEEAIEIVHNVRFLSVEFVKGTDMKKIVIDKEKANKLGYIIEVH